MHIYRQHLPHFQADPLTPRCQRQRFSLDPNDPRILVIQPLSPGIASCDADSSTLSPITEEQDTILDHTNLQPPTSNVDAMGSTEERVTSGGEQNQQPPCTSLKSTGSTEERVITLEAQNQQPATSTLDSTQSTQSNTEEAEEENTEPDIMIINVVLRPARNSYNQARTTSSNQTRTYNNQARPSSNLVRTTHSDPARISINEARKTTSNQASSTSSSQARTTSSNQARTTSSNQARTTSSNQARTTSSNQARTTSSNQARTTSSNQTRTTSSNQARTTSSNQVRTTSSNQAISTSSNLPKTSSIQTRSTSSNQAKTSSNQTKTSSSQASSTSSNQTRTSSIQTRSASSNQATNSDQRLPSESPAQNSSNLVANKTVAHHSNLTSTNNIHVKANCISSKATKRNEKKERKKKKNKRKKEKKDKNMKKTKNMEVKNNNGKNTMSSKQTRQLVMTTEAIGDITHQASKRQRLNDGQATNTTTTQSDPNDRQRKTRVQPNRKARPTTLHDDILPCSPEPHHKAPTLEVAKQEDLHHLFTSSTNPWGTLDAIQELPIHFLTRFKSPHKHVRFTIYCGRQKHMIFQETFGKLKSVIKPLTRNIMMGTDGVFYYIIKRNNIYYRLAPKLQIWMLKSFNNTQQRFPITVAFRSKDENKVQIYFWFEIIVGDRCIPVFSKSYGPPHHRSLVVMFPGGWFNIKMSSYQYRKSHCGDKTILRPSYLHSGISYTGKMTSLYWVRALVPVVCSPVSCSPATMFPQSIS